MSARGRILLVIVCAILAAFPARVFAQTTQNPATSPTPGTSQAPATSQTPGTTQTPGTSQTPQSPPSTDHTPQPYSPDEFQGWMKDLWRGEVLLVGSLPLTLFFSLETYGLYRYFNTGLNPTYAPWPFNTGSTINLSTQEATWVIISAVGLSFSVAVIDFMIGRWNATSKKP